MLFYILAQIRALLDLHIFVWGVIANQAAG